MIDTARVDLVAVELYKTEIKMNKPLIIGMSILDISKLKMVQFHYNVKNVNVKM